VIMIYGRTKCPTKVSSTSIVTINEDKKKQFLCNFIIKASYSSCALRNFKNDYVDLCALKSVIKQGCRVLDFEIYSLHGDAVVAVSTTSSHNEKGSYNSIDLSNVLKCVYENACDSTFTANTCPNKQDPLILNFRMKTSIIDIYNKMATQISTIFSTSLLSNAYNLDNNEDTAANYENNIWTTLTLGDVMGKVIIMVDSIDSNLANSRLYEIVNVVSTGSHTNLLTSNEVNYAMNGVNQNDEYYTSTNYRRMTVVLPSIHYRPVNYPATKCFLLGIQICCMCFQKKDKALDDYNKAFDDERSAFIIKNNDKLNNKVTLYAVAGTSTVIVPAENNTRIQESTEMGSFLPVITTDI
jgi:hypothetical protein